MWIPELVSVLQDLGIATGGTNLFSGPNAVIPSGDGPFYQLRDTSSLPPVGTHNDPSTPTFQRPSVQVTVRASDPDEAYSAAYAVYYALYSIRNQFVLDVWYLSVLPNQEPFQLLSDNEGRAVYTFNAVGDKLPSTAGGDLVGYYVIDALGGDPNAFFNPSGVDAYLSGDTDDKLVAGSSQVRFSALPTGTIVFEATARVSSAGGRAKIALFNLDTDVPIANGELVFDSGDTIGKPVRSAAIPVGINTRYGAKITTDNPAVGAAGSNIRILHL